MKLSDLIRNIVKDYISNQVGTYKRRSLFEFPDVEKWHLYELVIEKLYTNPVFCEVIMINDILFGMMNGHYKTYCARTDILERLSDICDDTFEQIIKEENYEYDKVPSFADEDRREL